MKLWRVEGKGDYAGGMAVVAARNEDEAIELANRDSGWRDWRVSCEPNANSCFNKVELIEDYEVAALDPVVLAIYGWRE